MISPDRVRGLYNIKRAIRYPDPGHPVPVCRFRDIKAELDFIGGKIEISADDTIVGSLNPQQRITWHRNGRLAHLEAATVQNGKLGISRLSFTYDNLGRLAERTTTKSFDGQVWRVIEREIFEYSTLTFTIHKPVSEGVVVNA